MHMSLNISLVLEADSLRLKLADVEMQSKHLQRWKSYV